jgi:hypothetical protein
MTGSDVELLVGKHKGLDLLPPTPFANKAQRQAPQLSSSSSSSFLSISSLELSVTQVYEP